MQYITHEDLQRFRLAGQRLLIEVDCYSTPMEGVVVDVVDGAFKFRVGCAFYGQEFWLKSLETRVLHLFPFPEAPRFETKDLKEIHRRIAEAGLANERAEQALEDAPAKRKRKKK